mmetsp:Transcript_139436/g.446031  ORF Transcript_139436/g.446031 Transcript_139436/m.446031 type:complete len:218 (+) Transcript_139436:1458-2111(+)
MMLGAPVYCVLTRSPWSAQSSCSILRNTGLVSPAAAADATEGWWSQGWWSPPQPALLRGLGLSSELDASWAPPPLPPPPPPPPQRAPKPQFFKFSIDEPSRNEGSALSSFSLATPLVEPGSSNQLRASCLAQKLRNHCQATKNCTTLVRSKQSKQLVRKTPTCHDCGFERPGGAGAEELDDVVASSDDVFSRKGANSSMRASSSASKSICEAPFTRA